MKLLILDLDETLIYGVERPLDRPPDFSVGPYFVYKRPGLDAFFEAVRHSFEIAVWTASTAAYAREVVAGCFPSDIPLSFLWARDRCTSVLDHTTGEYGWVKDLKKVKRQGYRLAQVLMLDDTPQKLARHYGNLLRIAPFEGCASDVELQRVVPFLLHLAEVPNIRAVEKRHWSSSSS